MAVTAAMPITVAADAAARVEELGMRREFQAILEHTKVAVQGLRAIEVTLEHDPYPDADPIVLITATMDDPGLENDPTESHWDTWMIENFSPDVGRHFVMITLFGATSNER